MIDAFRLEVAPLLPWPLIAVLIGVAVIAVGLQFWRRLRGGAFRLVATAVAAVALINPVTIRETREPLDSVVGVVVDRSASQALAGRPALTAETEAALRAALGALPGTEVRWADAPVASGRNPDGTRLVEAARRLVGTVPPERIGGVIFLTDGQVHDVPTAALPPFADAPVHVLLTGEPGEVDRRVVIEEAPRYGLVGRSVTVQVRVEDTDRRGEDGRRAVPLEIVDDDGTVRRLALRIGESLRFEVPVAHGGANLTRIRVPTRDGELTDRNNEAFIVVNGVRDRLRVLLVSGEPHAGERVWRNLLKSDPAVDLVHFTILRPPAKRDDAPVRELSLIAFPTRQLFQEKLDEFDLIIFDRYRRRGVLATGYFENIAEYVERGGSLLVAAGPDFASPLSLYRTPLASVLPATPTGEERIGGFKPLLTDTGTRHPVTAPLPGPGLLPDEEPRWGRWFRLIEATPRRGETLMRGHGDWPLLVLDEVGEGRVAQILSDQGWLWARGVEGGGPQAELLRRVAHWLMREPELEAESLMAAEVGGAIEITRRSMEDPATTVQLTDPTGAVTDVDLTPDTGGTATARVPVNFPGLYRVADGGRDAVVAIGSVNPLEFADVRADDTAMAPLQAAGGGATVWLGRDGIPTVRRVGPDRNAVGRNWIGVRDTQQYIVSGISETPMLPPIAAVILVLAALTAAWVRESR